MKKFVVLILSLFLFSNCQSQVKNKKSENNNDEIKPKTNIVVHKEYDENGNLVKIDSSYSYVYSNIKNDSLLEKKLFKNFKLNINKEFDEAFINNFFHKNEDLFKMNDFYTDDFFEKNIKREEQEMYKIMKMFDSIKNKFYKSQFPLEEPNNQKKLKKTL
jgi:hypothetical protein